MQNKQVKKIKHKRLNSIDKESFPISSKGSVRVSQTKQMAIVQNQKDNFSTITEDK